MIKLLKYLSKCVVVLSGLWRNAKDLIRLINTPRDPDSTEVLLRLWIVYFRVVAKTVSGRTIDAGLSH